MIKKFQQFLFENNSDLGEWVENQIQGNPDLESLVSQSTQDIDPTIRISAAVNLLPKSKQDFIVKMIKDYKSDNMTPPHPDVSATTGLVIENQDSDVGGKNMFKDFLKILTALGQAKLIRNVVEKLPANFLMFFSTDLLPLSEFHQVKSRYRFFQTNFYNLENLKGEVKLYYGFTDDLKFDYGVLFNSNPISLGSFGLSKKIMNWFLTLDSPSAVPLKREILMLDTSKFNLISKIKRDVLQGFRPGVSEHRADPTINGDIITFAYYGIGKWDNGVMDQGELDNIKQNFKTFIMSKDWSSKVKISTSTNNFWLYLKIMVK